MTYQQVSESYNKAVKEWNNLTPERQRSYEGYRILARMKTLSDQLKAFDQALSRIYN